jgi:peptidoglycan hydrolase-like protein with peptidoglycan-binding domain
MKRTLVLIIAVIMLGSMVLPGIAEQVNAADEQLAFEVLRNGSMNRDVRVLQFKLKELGYRIGNLDGIFGPRTEKALKDLQGELGLDQTGVIASQEEYDRILNAVKGDGVNMVWDGRFQNRDAYWENWGNPTVCEIVELYGQNWMHLVSSGTHWEGLMQDSKLRSAEDNRIELAAGQAYTLSFRAFAAGQSVGKAFTCGIHNVSLEEGKNREQYWTRNPELVLTAEPTLYRFTFTPTVDGCFRIMIGQGLEEAIEAFYTDIKIEAGDIATEWSEAPEMK